MPMMNFKLMCNLKLTTTKDKDTMVDNEKEEEKLRDIAIRLGAAIGMHPEEALERLILALQVDTMLRQRKLIQDMKDNFWEKEMLPRFKAILDGLPPNNHKG